MKALLPFLSKSEIMKKTKKQQSAGEEEKTNLCNCNYVLYQGEWSQAELALSAEAAHLSVYDLWPPAVHVPPLSCGEQTNWHCGLHPKL